LHSSSLNAKQEASTPAFQALRMGRMGKGKQPNLSDFSVLKLSEQGLFQSRRRSTIPEKTRKKGG